MSSSRDYARSSNKRHERRHQSGRRGGSSSQEQYAPDISFVFVVHELKYDRPISDEYHHLKPPVQPHHYTHELQSTVMRYRNGTVSAAPEYLWSRDEDRNGDLWYQDFEGNMVTARKYNTFAVFACNPLLPILVCNRDPYVVNTTNCWELLQIHHPIDMFEGISQVAVEDSTMGGQLTGGLVRHAAGQGASWMPSLIPNTYRATSSYAPPSRGLGGELAIILGLMALSARPNVHGINANTDRVFLGDHNHPPSWHNGVWSETRSPRGYPANDREDPRGFLVVVCFDEHNPDGSNEQMLHHFEWEQAIVVDPPS